MIARVLISKQLLSNFRKKALSIYPNEYMMTVWGKIEGDAVQVESLREVSQKSTEGSVTASFTDCVTSSKNATFLGTIHTHPDSTDATPSQADWDSSFACGEYIFGIMKIAKGRTETKWWEPRPEISMIHPRVRQGKDVGIRSSSKNARCVAEVLNGESVNSQNALSLIGIDTILSYPMTGVITNETI